jgi:hypothetical protein
MNGDQRPGQQAESIESGERAFAVLSDILFDFANRLVYMHMHREVQFVG